MKKRLLIGISVLSLILCCIIIFAVQSAKIIGEEGLIAKARKEIRNLADAETIEMVVAGNPPETATGICSGLSPETNIRHTIITPWK